MNAFRLSLLACVLMAFANSTVSGQEAVKLLADLDVPVLDGDRSTWQAMIRTDLNERLASVNQASRRATFDLESLEQWQAFSRDKIQALRDSLGHWPVSPQRVQVEVTSTSTGDGYRIENILFESRPGWWVTANLYSPLKPRKSMPGILLSHSHHQPKEQGELQDMGMTWARAGCVVLVPDHLGHGERRQHPFASAADYGGEFRVSRQDYYFRYDTGIQLHLVGDSLIGWMVWDLMRGVDLLLSRDGVDPDRIILLGAVAGGGDPAAVTAALDPRIDCAVPFNFGGPQPETRYPLPEDAETTFNYSGSGGWESTRNLRRSAADGFLPYVIVGSVAPRRLIFAHEFNWHRERDPVWKRLRRIYELHGTADSLAYTHGRGELKGRPPEATHCTNIGPYHRQRIHESFRRWYEIDVRPETEYSTRRESAQLKCMTDEARMALKPKRLVDLLPKRAQQQLAGARLRREELSPDKRTDALRRELAAVLGDVSARQATSVKSRMQSLADEQGRLKLAVQRVALETDPDMMVPLLMLRSSTGNAEERHVVIGLAQAGKSGFLKHRGEQLQELLDAGYIVCLADLRGTGETRPEQGRGQYSTDTGRSSTELMLGGTTVGTRLRDLRSIMRFLREDEATQATGFTLWGDSFAAPNPRERNFHVPRRIDGRPLQSEPLGGFLALLAALYESDVRAVYIHGGLHRFGSVLEHQQVLIPHDIVVPGLLRVADIDDLAAAVAPRPLILTGMVDHLNRTATEKETRALLPHTHSAFRAQQAEDKFSVAAAPRSPASWLKKNREQSR